MKFKYAAEICKIYKDSGKCPLSNICKKHIELSREDVEVWTETLEARAKDLFKEENL